LLSSHWVLALYLCLQEPDFEAELVLATLLDGHAPPESPADQNHDGSASVSRDGLHAAAYPFVESPHTVRRDTPRGSVPAAAAGPSGTIRSRLGRREGATGGLDPGFEEPAYPPDVIKTEQEQPLAQGGAAGYPSPRQGAEENMYDDDDAIPSTPPDEQMHQGGTGLPGVIATADTINYF
jgi:hypothetical protein